MAWGNRQFVGAFPKISARLLPENAALAAINCWLDRGYPRPLPALQALVETGEVQPRFPVGVQSIYRFDGEGTSSAPDRWFAWAEDVDVAPSPIAGDTERRTIWTGDDYPRQTSTRIMAGGGFTSPGKPISRALGIPAPAQPPTAALGTRPANADDERQAQSDAWVFTFLSDLDEEGPPSPPTATLSREFGTDGALQPVTLTFPTSAPAGRFASTGINRKRVYRTATGQNGVTTYQLLTTLNISTATFTDSAQTTALGETLVSETWEPPPADLKGIIPLPNGVLAGFVDRSVYFSEPYQPHAWPPEYIQSVDADIVGLANFGLNVVVGTQGKPYLVSGTHPSIASVARMEFDQALASKRSFATVDQQGVVFASPEGLVIVQPAGGRFISREAYDRQDWQALGPETFRGAYHDGAYLAFADDKVTILSPEMEGSITVEDAGVRAVFHDTERDKVYVVDSGRDLREWTADASGGKTLRTMRWRSRLHVGVPRPYSAAQVIAEGYPVTLRLFGDGQSGAPDDIPLATLQVTSDAPFRLASTYGLQRYWSYEVEAAHAVNEVRIGTMAEMGA